MAADAAFVVVVSICSVVAGLSAGMTGFGRAILFHVLMVVVLLISPGLSGNEGDGSGFSQGVAVLAVQGACMAWPQAVHTWKDFNPALFLLFMLPAALFVFVGTLLLVDAPERQIKLGVGGVLFAFALWRWYWTFSHPPPPVKDRHPDKAASTSGLKPAPEDVDLEGGSAKPSAMVGPQACSTASTVSTVATSVASDNSGRDWDGGTAHASNGTGSTVSPGARDTSPLPPQSTTSAPLMQCGNTLDTSVLSIMPLEATQVDSCLGADGSLVPAAPQQQPGDAAPVAAPCTTRLAAWVWDHRLAKPLAVAAVAAGSASGFLLGVSGVAGPPIMVFAALANFDKSVLRATFTCVIAISTTVQAANLFAVGVVQLAEWPLYLGATAGVLLGITIGNVLHHKISQEACTRVILGLLSLSAAMLLGQGNALYIFSALLVIAVAAALMWRCTRSRSAKVVPVAMAHAEVPVRGTPPVAGPSSDATAVE